MSAAVRLATLVMLGAGGLFTGGVVWYAWERVWIWRRLALSAYAVDFRRSVRKADPALPILLVVCAAAAGVFASLTSGAARTLALAGIALLAVILVSSIIYAEPINSQFRRLPEGPSRPVRRACAAAEDVSTSSAPRSRSLHSPCSRPR